MTMALKVAVSALADKPKLIQHVMQLPVRFAEFLGYACGLVTIKIKEF